MDSFREISPIRVGLELHTKQLDAVVLNPNYPVFNRPKSSYL